MLAVAGYDGIIRIYDTASHAQVATLHGDEGHIWSMAFSPDGSTLAAGSNVLQWWDVAADKLIADENSPGGDVTDVAFSPDGTILTAGGYEIVGLWDARTRQLVVTLSLGLTAPLPLPHIRMACRSAVPVRSLPSDTGAPCSSGTSSTLAGRPSDLHPECIIRPASIEARTNVILRAIPPCEHRVG